MTRICVAGGTGQVGSEVVRQALLAGHDVTVVSRKPPAHPRRHDGAHYFPGDVTTGEGLADALAGTAVVVDCLEGRTGKSLRTFAGGGSRLLEAAHGAGTGRAVLLSIINCDQGPLRYYRSKAEKEQVYAHSPLETLTVRTTQFHSLLVQLFAAGSKIGLIPVFRGVRFQTIAPADVASALLEAALEGPSPDVHRLRTVGGPEINGMAELAQTWKRQTGSRGLLVGIPLPGAMGAYLREGRNLIPEQRYGRQTFASWLANESRPG